MPDLKLARLPDRTPVKLAINISPDLDRQLQAYAGVYNETYGEDEKVADLVPFMLQQFLAADRNFNKARKRAPKGMAIRASRGSSGKGERLPSAAQ